MKDDKKYTKKMLEREFDHMVGMFVTDVIINSYLLFQCITNKKFAKNNGLILLLFCFVLFTSSSFILLYKYKKLKQELSENISNK